MLKDFSDPRQYSRAAWAVAGSIFSELKLGKEKRRLGGQSGLQISVLIFLDIWRTQHYWITEPVRLQLSKPAPFLPPVNRSHNQCHSLVPVTRAGGMSSMWAGSRESPVRSPTESSLPRASWLRCKSQTRPSFLRPPLPPRKVISRALMLGSLSCTCTGRSSGAGFARCSG